MTIIGMDGSNHSKACLFVVQYDMNPQLASALWSILASYVHFIIFTAHNSAAVFSL